MDPTEYRRLTSRPGAFRRAVLEDTVRILRRAKSPLVEILEEVVSGPAIPKPPLHAVGSEADFFQLDLSLEDADAILDELLDAEAEARSAGASTLTSPGAPRLAELVERWALYREWLDDGRAA